MQNAILDKAQGGIKISGRNINNFRYSDGTTLTAESEEELKSFLMKVKEESGKSWLRTRCSKNDIMAFSPITSWQIGGETMEIVTDFIFLGSKISVDSDCSHEIERLLLLGRKAMTNFSLFQFSCSVVSTLCNSIDCRMPGFSVHHQLPELAKTHVR